MQYAVLCKTFCGAAQRHRVTNFLAAGDRAARSQMAETAPDATEQRSQLRQVFRDSDRLVAEKTYALIDHRCACATIVQFCAVLCAWCAVL